MGTPEMVVKRAWPFSSRLTPVGSPMGRSGDFSSAGASVFSAHCFSPSEGWRFLKTSTTGESMVPGFMGSAITAQSIVSSSKGKGIPRKKGKERIKGDKDKKIMRSATRHGVKIAV